MGATLLIARWMLTVAFLLAGGAKLARTRPMVELFETFGLPSQQMMLVGALEVAGAIGVQVPYVTTLAALGLAVLMGFAVSHHMRVGHSYGQTAPAAILGGVAVFVVWQTWPLLGVPA